MVSIAREQPALTVRVDVRALANAVTAVALAAYIICATLALVAPDLLIWFFQPWFHGLSLDPLRPTGAWFRPGEAIVGLITFPSFHAAAAVLLGWLYYGNRLLRWPFVLLNAGMALSAIVVGGHYLVDIIGGVVVAILGITVATGIDRRENDRSGGRVGAFSRRL